MNTHIDFKVGEIVYNTRYKFEGIIKEITIKNSRIYLMVTMSSGSTTGDFLENWQTVIKCITKGCENHKHQGKFVNDLCAPCWKYITEGQFDKLALKSSPRTVVQTDLTAEGTKVFVNGKEVKSFLLTCQKVRPSGSSITELSIVLRY